MSEYKNIYNAGDEEAGKNDPFWSEENQTWLRESIKQIEEGNFSKHELTEIEGFED